MASCGGREGCFVGEIARHFQAFQIVEANEADLLDKADDLDCNVSTITIVHIPMLDEGGRKQLFQWLRRRWILNALTSSRLFSRRPIGVVLSNELFISIVFEFR